MKTETVQARSPLPRHAAAKADRRARIVAAAADLVRETSIEEVSMVAIAARAGLSPATLYNLFDTKAAIFLEVFDRDVEQFTRKVRAVRARGAVDRIFVAIDIAASLYRRNPKFYRAMAHAGDTPLNRAISGPRRAFWQNAVADAVAAGELRANTDAQLLGGLLMQIMRGHFLDWAAGAISVDRLAKETAYGFALALSSYATEGRAAEASKRLRALEAAVAGGGKRKKHGGLDAL